MKREVSSFQFGFLNPFSDDHMQLKLLRNWLGLNLVNLMSKSGCWQSFATHLDFCRKVNSDIGSVGKEVRNFLTCCSLSFLYFWVMISCSLVWALPWFSGGHFLSMIYLWFMQLGVKTVESSKVLFPHANWAHVKPKMLSKFLPLDFAKILQRQPSWSFFVLMYTYNR